MAKVDGGLNKLIVQCDGESHTERKGENHTRSSNGQRVLGIAFENPYVNLQTDEKEKEYKSEGRRQGKDRDGVLGEYSVGEMGDATHDGWSKDDTTDDLGNHTGL